MVLVSIVQSKTILFVVAPNRKRKWLDKVFNEIFSYDWDLSELDGTRLNSEFVSFLKRRRLNLTSLRNVMA